MITPDEARLNAEWLANEGYEEDAEAIRDLAQQVEDLQKDAARYQFLRKSHPDVGDGFYVGKDSLNGWGNNCTTIFRNAKLDKAIDEAMK